VPREDAIKVEGKIVEVLKETLFCVELPNGHRLLARVPVRARYAVAGRSAGDKVIVEISPYDLSKGCITPEESI
jgi:translation initiation factor IF-1